MSLIDKLEKAKELKLSTSSKEAIKHNLNAFISQNPAKAAKFSFVSFTYLRKYKYAPVAVLLIIILSAGTSLAAEGALPGETLYTIKTRVNERVKDLAHRTSKSKVGLQARLIEERLEEIQILASEGKLDDEKKSQVERLMNIRVGNFNQHLARIASSSAYSAQADLYNHLSAHKEVIESLMEDFEDNENLGSVLSQVQLMESRMKPNIKLLVETEEAEEIKNSAAKRIEKVSDMMQKDKEDLHLRALEQAREELVAGQESLREGAILDDQGNATSARETLRNADRAAERAKRILEIHKKIRLKNKIESGQIIERS